MSFFEELKRRNVFRVGIAYAIVAWLLLQLSDILVPLLNLPESAQRFVLLALIIGFFPALIFAWAFEMTPEGVKRESEVDRTQSITPQTGRKLDRSIIIVLVLAVAFLLYRQVDAPPQTPSPTTMAETASVAESSNTSEAESGPVTIAVLPFVNMSSDPEQEYFSDGITEEILNRLARIRELQVAARTSVFSFKGQDQDIRKIAEMLGVSTILEGSVRRDGEQVRITAQLIRASDGFHLWSESYDRKLENIFAIQDDISSQIAAALQISLGITGSEAGRPEKTVNPEVYDLYLKARGLHRQRKGLLEALELFQKALDIDPQFAPAWAGLAHSYDVVEFYLTAETLEGLGDIRAKSLAAAQKALQLDPELATALHAMGNNQWLQGEWAAAMESYERALQLDPGSTDLMEDYSQMLVYSMQLEAARKVAERMVTLDPYVPVFLNAVINMYDTRGEYEKRDKYIDILTTRHPDFRYTYAWNIERLLGYGRTDELHRYIDQIDLSTWTTSESMHKAVDWLADSQQTPNNDVLQALSFRRVLPIKVGRPDVFFDLVSDQIASEAFPAVPRLLLPPLSAEEVRNTREYSGTRELLKTARLPEFWRTAGWPDMCSPVGEDDFECH